LRSTLRSRPRKKKNIAKTSPLISRVHNWSKTKVEEEVEVLDEKISASGYARAKKYREDQAREKDRKEQEYFRQKAKTHKWDGEKWNKRENVKEEVVNEVSKKTLGSYVKKASTQMATSAMKGDYKKMKKRHKGVLDASDKLAKEDYHSGQGEKVVARTKKYMEKKGQKGAPGLDAMKARTADHKAKRGVKEEAVSENFLKDIVKKLNQKRIDNAAQRKLFQQNNPGGNITKSQHMQNIRNAGGDPSHMMQKNSYEPEGEQLDELTMKKDKKIPLGQKSNPYGKRAIAKMIIKSFAEKQRAKAGVTKEGTSYGLYKGSGKPSGAMAAFTKKKEEKKKKEETVKEAKVDKLVPDHKRSGKRLDRYGNPHGSLALGGGIQRDRRADHADRRGKKTKGVAKESVKYYSGQDRDPKTGLPKGLKSSGGSKKEKPMTGVDYSNIQASYQPKFSVFDEAADRKMGRATDQQLADAHKKFSGMDQSSPANAHMTKRITKEMNRRQKAAKKKVDEEVGVSSSVSMMNARKEAELQRKETLAKKKKGVKEHHQKDSNGKVIEHGDGSPSSIDEATRLKKEKGYDKGGTKKPSGNKQKDAALSFVLDKIKKEHGKGAVMRSGSKQQKKSRGAKSTAGTGKYKKMSDDRTQLKKDAKEMGYGSNTKGYIETRARHGSKENMKSGRGLGS